MANITQVEVNGTTYDICDAVARDSIDSLTPLKLGAIPYYPNYPLYDYNDLYRPGVYGVHVYLALCRTHNIHAPSELCFSYSPHIFFIFSISLGGSVSIPTALHSSITPSIKMLICKES